MKALVQTALGEPTDVLELIDIAASERMEADEVLIEVRLAPIHHGDLHLIRSQPSIEGGNRMPRGSEGVGIVRALGSNVEGSGKLVIGDRVIGFPAPGAWAERLVVPATAAVLVPSDVTDEVAAQLLINFATARMIMRALRRSVPEPRLHDGAVLVTGASTVVARLLIHLLAQDGLTPIGLARSVAGANRVSAELASVGIVASQDPQWRAQLTTLVAGRKVVAVLDCVSGSLMRDLVPLLADEAAIVTYGSLGGRDLGIGGPELIDRQFVVRGVKFGRWFSDLTPQEQQDDIQAAFRVARELPWLFKVAGVYDLADFRDAVAAVEATDRDGFILVRPSRPILGREARRPVAFAATLPNDQPCRGDRIEVT